MSTAARQESVERAQAAGQRPGAAACSAYLRSLSLGRLCRPLCVRCGRRRVAAAGGGAMVVFVSSPSSLSACERTSDGLCVRILAHPCPPEPSDTAAFGLSGAGDAPLERRQMRPDLGQESGRRCCS
ncbi:hypothetical protein K458DRAFT_94026 [Lentithecium fluviatile CBS 122367]|uniref:Uncharacterized protein n=1 Tax=Lentithecium fluviatile CBS 122367 TaxID=1168545 RepID=A0A6G1IQ20_9PLEO|nr:hypothetical protein K458DRAFT_94026 [Lentithecium fluviatile CBS 122367]